MKILLVTSPGGHLAHLLALHSWWQDQDRLWVTAQQPDTELALEGERVVWSHWPTTRHLPNALKNLALAVKVLRAERPDVIVSDGAGVTLVGWMMRMGFLVTSPAIGVAATGIGLQWALGLLLVLGVVAAACSPALKVRVRA